MTDDAAKWEERYREGDVPWDTGQPSSELVRCVSAEKIAPCRALELGCGTGASSVWLAGQGFDVTGIDIAILAVRIAQARAAVAGKSVRFLAGDITALPNLGAAFDFFFDRGCYHAVRRTNAAGYLAALSRWTKPGTVGLVLMGNAKEKAAVGPPVVTEEEIRRELGGIFNIEWLREFRFDEKPGSSESFLGWSCFLRRV